MADEKTINAFVPNRGDLRVTISAAAVTAIAGLTTAEAISIKGVLRTFERSNNPARPVESQRVSGHAKPLSFVGGIEETETWKIVILDDKSKGAAGEWGTDNLSAVDIFRWHLDAEIPLGGLAATPAGSATGMIEYSLQSPIDVISVSVPKIDADAKKADEIEIVVSCPSHTPAARA
jgi:hypothetical protein